MLERDEHRHQLRDRRDRQALALVVRASTSPVAGVLDEVRPRVDRAVARPPQRRRERALRGETPGGGRASFTRRGLYFTRIRWPIVSATGSTSGLSTSSCSTVVSCWSAIDGERVAGLDHVELGAGGVGRRRPGLGRRSVRSSRCVRRRASSWPAAAWRLRRRRVPERTSSTAIVAASEERGRRRVPREPWRWPRITSRRPTRSRSGVAPPRRLQRAPVLVRRRGTRR